MSTQLVAPSHTAPARHRRVRTAAAIAGVAALAAGGYVSSTTSGPDTTAPTRATGTDVNLSAETQRVLNRSIAGQYGGQSAAGRRREPERPDDARAALEHRRPVRPAPGAQASAPTATPGAPGMISGHTGSRSWSCLAIWRAMTRRWISFAPS